MTSAIFGPLSGQPGEGPPSETTRDAEIFDASTSRTMYGSRCRCLVTMSAHLVRQQPESASHRTGISSPPASVRPRSGTGLLWDITGRHHWLGFWLRSWGLEILTSSSRALRSDG